MKQYKKNVEDLRNRCAEFLETVEAFGNECAYTDSILESILRAAAAIKEAYDNDGTEATQ